MSIDELVPDAANGNDYLRMVRLILHVSTQPYDEIIDRARVRGIGVSGQQHGFVPLDAKGGVIRPAKLWCDTSTRVECALLTKKLGGPRLTIRKTGNLVLPGFTAPKILWLKRHEPANYKRLRHVLLPHDFLNFHLTGNYFMEFGDASGTALMDVRRRAWSRDALRAIDGILEDILVEDGHGVKTGTPLFKIATRNTPVDTMDDVLQQIINSTSRNDFGALLPFRESADSSRGPNPSCPISQDGDRDMGRGIPGM